VLGNACQKQPDEGLATRRMFADDDT
jgi:hypothetical protein